MRFANMTRAKEYSRDKGRKIYCLISGVGGVFEVYPGGRSIKWPASPRYLRRLAEFDTDETARLREEAQRKACADAGLQTVVDQRPTGEA